MIPRRYHGASMLRRLHTKDVGPAREMDLALGSRLNVLTGDNGLGKSFVLELVWFVLTGTFAGTPALPSGGTPQLRYEGTPNEKGRAAAFLFEHQAWSWNGVAGRGPRGSVIYLGAERMAAFVLYRNHFPQSISVDGNLRNEPSAFVFEGRELWDGKEDASGRPLCNGLIRDWVNWMRSRPAASTDASSAPRPAPFQLLERVLTVLSPNPRELLVAGPPRRVTIGDAREIPTLVTSWDSKPVPVTLASAGVRRVLELAYTLVWAWQEHNQIAEILQQPPQREIFLLIDEPETHLHPRWQQTILPALMSIAEVLDPELKLQLFVTTHSPIVLASVESLVDPERDRLFHFDDRGDEVHVDALDWIKHGDAVGWLGSEAIGLEGGGRSLAAEEAIRWADAFMLGKHDEIPEAMRSRAALDAELRRVLAADDEYWTYWFVPQGDVAP
jgi:AAA domain, putative AbiEii toxin, Type IV TA system